MNCDQLISCLQFANEDKRETESERDLICTQLLYAGQAYT